VKLLVLGGTRFLGRHLATDALARGHSVTLVHRGRSAGAQDSNLARAEHLIGDRDHDLPRLLGGQRTWDAAIDTSAYVPRQVREAVRVLGERVGHYQLVSSISVYRDEGVEGPDEEAALATLDDPTTEAVTGETYGALKALCEQALLQALGPRAGIVRPGLIVGPFDTTERFGWWARRVQRGGSVLAPGTPQDPVQFIDARDAAAFMLALAERGQGGAYNLNGPTEPLTMGAWLETLRDELRPDAVLQWVDAQVLLDQGVAPWSDLPLWLPPALAGMHRTRIERALAAGLRCRPLAQTVRDAAAWLGSRPAPTQHPPGITPEREAELLAAWARHRA
jgi:2'-hydroxyisoflavone reductase